jgi:hypothetical protein
MTARGRPPGQAKTGGRKLGTKNRLQVTEEMRLDILGCYEKLGGPAFLLRWAKENQSEFVKQCLSRFFPPMPREDPELINQSLTINAGSLSDFEAATRIAFALSKGMMQETEPVAVQRVEPQEADPVEPDLPSLDEVKITGMVGDPTREAWAEDLKLSQDERLVKETQQATIEDYPGSSDEQGLARRKRSLL